MVDKAFEFITHFEGFHHEPYPDGDGWSIGHGLNAKGRTWISYEESAVILRAEIKRLDKIIMQGFKYEPLNSSQRAAMVSLAYNLANPHIFEQDKILKNAILYGEINDIGWRWTRYRNSGGQYMCGLEIRRKYEVNKYAGFKYYRDPYTCKKNK